jgi:hypothetical protein
MPPALPSLTDLSLNAASLPCLFHGLANRRPSQIFGRAVELAWQVGRGTLLDWVAPLVGCIRSIQTGGAAFEAPGIALYAHWSPSGRISSMVARQVAAWRGCGLDIVFVTSTTPPAEELAAILPHCALIIQRANVGYDFAAWRDALNVLHSQGHRPAEILLANDSVLGPFQPLPPLVAMMRAGGQGLFGFTESVAGGVHLQSYALLARGPQAVAELTAHLDAIPNWRSKWRLVQGGEIGLTARMRRANIRCAALFPYAALCHHARADDLEALGARSRAPRTLADYPLNPTHHLWRLLLDCGFPFIKTELVRRNPGRLPNLVDWAGLVAPDDAALAEAHLRLMDGHPGDH